MKVRHCFLTILQLNYLKNKALQQKQMTGPSDQVPQVAVVLQVNLVAYYHHITLDTAAAAAATRSHGLPGCIS